MDTSEYDRIKELKKQSPNMKPFMKDNMKEIATQDETPNETRVLQVEVEVLRERIKDKDQTIDDLREDRDEWKKQAQTLLLQSPSNKPIHAEASEDQISSKPHSINLTLIAVLLLVTLGMLAFMVSLMNQKQVAEGVTEEGKGANVILEKPIRSESVQEPGTQELHDLFKPKHSFTPVP